MFHNIHFNQTWRYRKLTLKKLWNDAQAILFDFDGVLADSEPFYRKSWNIVLSEYGHSVSEKDYWKHWAFYGKGLAGELSRTGLHLSGNQQVEARAAQKRIYADYCTCGDIPLFPSAAAVLDLAMSKKPCVIASNTDSFLVKTIIGNKVKTVPSIIGGEGLRAKPCPDIFLKASRFLHTDNSRCLIFEDAWKGIKAGITAGIPCVLVRNKYNNNIPVTEASCEISSLEQLYLFLKQNK